LIGERRLFWWRWKERGFVLIGWMRWQQFYIYRIFKMIMIYCHLMVVMIDAK